MLNCGKNIAVIGIGVAGSHIATLLYYLTEKLYVVDFDTVEKKNMVNQIYRTQDIGRPKAEALAGMLPGTIPLVSRGESVSCTVFCDVNLVVSCPDSLASRRAILERLREIGYSGMYLDVRTLGGVIFAYSAPSLDALPPEYMDSLSPENLTRGACGIVTPASTGWAAAREAARIESEEYTMTRTICQPKEVSNAIGQTITIA